MKIRLEMEDNLTEDEIVIHCRELTDEIVALQRQIAEAVHTGMQLHVVKGETSYFLKLDEILFLETDQTAVAVHTVNQIYETKQRLYELEELLPGSFMRVSKSTIINTDKIRAIRKNITGASEVEFSGSNKKAFVSRNYFRALMHKIEEKRLKK
jgi:DNA-binding LytR/AlgR family response regulator